MLKNYVIDNIRDFFNEYFMIKIIYY